MSTCVCMFWQCIARNMKTVCISHTYSTLHFDHYLCHRFELQLHDVWNYFFKKLHRTKIYCYGSCQWVGSDMVSLEEWLFNSSNRVDFDSSIIRDAVISSNTIMSVASFFQRDKYAYMLSQMRIHYIIIFIPTILCKRTFVSTNAHHINHPNRPVFIIAPNEPSTQRKQIILCLNQFVTLSAWNIRYASQLTSI